MDEGRWAVRLKHDIVHARGLANKNRALLSVCPDCVQSPVPSCSSSVRP